MGVNVMPTKDSAGNIVQLQAPFASKGTIHFRGSGTSLEVPAGQTANIDFEITYPKVKYNGIEVLNGDYGDTVQLQVLDTDTGTYSTVPSMVLDQFGINWNMAKELKQLLPYEATILQGMKLRVVYFNSTASAKTIYVNHYIHEEL